MDFQTMIAAASAWIEENSTDVLYVGIAITALFLIGDGRR